MQISPTTTEAKIKNETIDTAKEFDDEEIRIAVLASKRFCHWKP
jgi:hypothetical protein